MIRTATAHLVTGLLLATPLLFSVGCARQDGIGPQTARRPIGPSTPPPTGVKKYVEGVALQRANQPEQAIAALEEATTTNPKLTMARALLGDLYKDRGDYSEAADQYKAVTELDPYTGRNYYKLGVAYHLLQRMQPAIEAYLEALRLDPRDWESHMNVGLVYLALGRKEQAISNLTQATIINANAGVAFGNLAIALDATGRFPEAEAAYRRALELDPQDTASLGNLGKNLMRQGKNEAAVAVLKRLVDLTESSSARKLYADALVQAKRQDEAIKLYRTILADDARYYPALNGLAGAMISKYEQSLQLDARQRKAAVEAWRTSLSINPLQPRVEENLKKWAQQ